MFNWIKKIIARKRNGEYLLKEVERSLEDILTVYALPDSNIFTGVRKYLQSMYDRKDENAIKDIAKLKMDLIQELNDVIDVIKISYSTDYEKYKKKSIEFVTRVKIDVIKIFETTNETTKINYSGNDATFLASLTKFRKMLNDRHK